MEEAPEVEGFPPSPPEGFGAGEPAAEEPGIAIMVDTLRDPQFWKDCPVELGSVLELPLLRHNGEEEEKGLVCVYVADVYRAESGLYLGVKMLGADAQWCRLEGVKMFSRERRRVHVCRVGPVACEEANPKLWHIQDFSVFPPGSHPPKYVEKVKLKEWRKLYAATMEERTRGDPRKRGAEPERREEEGAPDRVAALRRRLQARKGIPPAGAGQEAGQPTERDRLSPLQPVAAASHRQVAALGNGGDEREPEPAKEDRRRARSPSMKAALADAVAQRNQRKTRSRSPHRRRRDSRSPSRKKKKKKKRGRRRRDSRDSRSGSSEGSSTSSSLLPPLQKKAAKHPGSVLKMLLESVGEALADAAGARRRGEPVAGPDRQNDVILPDRGQAATTRESPGPAGARDAGPLHRLAGPWRSARTGRCSSREIPRGGISRSDEQLARCATPGSHPGPARGTGATSSHAESPEAHQDYRKSNRAERLGSLGRILDPARKPWPQDGRERRSKRERRRSRSRQRWPERQRSMEIAPGERQRKGRAERRRRGSSSCSERRQMSGPGEAFAAGETQVAPLVAEVPGEGSCAPCADPSAPEAWPDELLQQMLGAHLASAFGSGGPAECSEFNGGVSLDPYVENPAEVPPFRDPGAGMAAIGRTARAFSNAGWADFECPRALGRALAEGVSQGSLPTGMELLFQEVKHTASQDAFGRAPALFPLPVDFSLEELTGEACDNSVGAWLALVCHGLNVLSGCKKKPPRRRTGRQVAEVLKVLKDRIGRFLTLFSPVVVDPQEVWLDVLSKRISYDGEEFVEPVALTYEQIYASLPPMGHGGSVELSPLLVGRAEYLIQRPEELLLDPELKEAGPNAARVHIALGEAMKVWQLLEERGIIEWIDLEEVYADEGGPYLAGMFGVPKAGKFTPCGEPLLRVIMNLKPINRALDIVKGDIGELPMATTWNQLMLDESETIHISQADMSSAFYLFSLPSQWRRFMAFNAPTRGSALGREAGKVFVPACKVLPMGWSSSVGLMQMASRQLVQRCHAWGADELKRQALAPRWFVDTVARAGPRLFWQVYLDNFMAGEVSLKGLPDSASGELHRDAVAAWTQEGVLCAEDKHVLSAQDATELGVHLNGEQGLVGAGPQRLHRLLVATLMLLGERLPKIKWVQIVLGRWVFALQFRRPAMAILSQSWNYGRKGQDRRRWWPIVKQELGLLVCLVPLLQTDLRAGYSPVVTCSDASHFGGAVGTAVSLTCAGGQLTRVLQDRALEAREVELLVVSAFNGIGGAFRGYDLAGVKPRGLIAIEWSKSAQRVTRKAWPRVIEIGDINDVMKSTVRAWSNQFPRVTHVHLVGGFPCVHLSAVRAGRENLQGEGSKLFWNLVALLGWIRDVFGATAEVDFIIENVLSMDTSARREISQVLGVEPYALCPSDLLAYNRPRLAWVSMDLKEGRGVRFEHQEGFIRVWMTGEALSDEQWITPGWARFEPDGKLPTFMKAIPRRRPPERPAGMARCDSTTIERWTSDQFRFPPYQYKLENMLEDEEGALRYCNAEERCLLLGFGFGHTRFAMSASQAKGHERELEDLELSLCGDSFSMLSFGWIISQLCAPWVEPRTPTELVRRFGLAPGCSLQADLAVPLRRQLGYGPNPINEVGMEELTAQLSRHVNHTGGDVSLSLGTPYSNKSSNHLSLRADWWTWRILFTTKWKYPNHINYLELKMILQSIRWRARSTSSLSSRWLHLSDSMVCNYVLSKGRTSSKLLQPMTREIAAYLLALNSHQLQGHVDSAENPTDAASREAPHKKRGSRWLKGKPRDGASRCGPLASASKLKGVTPAPSARSCRPSKLRRPWKSWTRCVRSGLKQLGSAEPL